MAEQTIRASARVALTVEVHVTSAWGPDCPIRQIHKQAEEEAIGMLTRALTPPVQSEAERAQRREEFQLVGTPSVTAVLVRVSR